MRKVDPRMLHRRIEGEEMIKEEKIDKIGKEKIGF